MISLHYTFSNYKAFLDQFAEKLNTQLEGNRLTIPPEVGSGFFQIINLDLQLQALIYDITLNDDLYLHRDKTELQYYMLVFDRSSEASGASISIGLEKPIDDHGRSYALYLTSNTHAVEYTLQRGVNLSGFRILLPLGWMEKYVELQANQEMIERYHQLKTVAVWYMPVDEELKMLLNEVLYDHDIPFLFYQNRIFRIIESFFTWLYTGLQQPEVQSLSTADIENAQRVEAILTNDITVVPPTIRELAREIAVSESKLKKIFKLVYGMPPYEYYQKQRMQKAHNMLLEGEYSIKDVGYTLGYANLSNFTLAFKKEFGLLPSEVMKRKFK